MRAIRGLIAETLFSWAIIIGHPAWSDGTMMKIQELLISLREDISNARSQR